MAEVAYPPSAPSFMGKPIIRDQLSPSTSIPRAAFDPSKHLIFKEKPKVLTLSDIGLPDDIGISPVAVSDPFPLFDEEAIRIMRSEIFTIEVWENCLHSTGAFGCHLRGHCPKYAPFMYDAWTHPKTLKTVSKIAGIDLVPIINIEIGNINVSVQDPNDSKDKLASDELPVTKWHVDSYPFVCVVMMSDTSNMVGGETAIRTGTGEIMKIRGPQMGFAVILQGRCITHQALAAVGGTERITMTMVFKARDALVLDSTVLTTVRPISDLNELYFQWTEYRVEVLQDRLRAMRKELEAQHRAGRPTDKERIKAFLKQQEEYLVITN